MEIQVIEVRIKTVEEMISLGETLASCAKPNQVIGLNGDLGAGKTVFTKGFAASLEIDETITSPSFNIIKEYYSGMVVGHIVTSKRMK